MICQLKTYALARGVQARKHECCTWALEERSQGLELFLRHFASMHEWESRQHKKVELGW